MNSASSNKEIVLPPETCPWRGWAGNVLAILFAFLVTSIIFDRAAEKLLAALAWTMLAFAAVTDTRPRRLLRLTIALAGLFFVLTGATIAAWSNPHFIQVVYNFVRYQVGVIWIAVLWLASAVFLPADSETSPPRRFMKASLWMQSLVALILLLAVQATISASASLFPKDSMKLLGSELVPYAGIFIILVRSAACANSGWWKVAARVSWMLIVISCMAMATIALLALASHKLSDVFLQADLFRVDSDAPGTRRLQFLFYHHNRAGFFAACGLFICLAGTWGKPLWRVIGIAGAAGAAVALPFTLTRGALIAAACGMLLFTLIGLLRKRRGRWALLLALLIGTPVLWITLPQNYKAHIEKITNVKNYHIGAGGSIGARFVMWDVARAMIVKRPFLGFGYGFENFESTARMEHPEIPNYFKDAAHAHNHWLETGAEIGIPGMILLGLFTLVRLSGLAWYWWRSARAGKQWAWLLLLWLCLEVTIQLYGMTNYTLRRNLGYLTYGIWAGSVIICITSRNANAGIGSRNPELVES